MTIDWKLVATFVLLMSVILIAHAADPVAVSVDFTLIILAVLTALPLIIAQVANLITSIGARKDAAINAAKILEETVKTGKAVDGKMEEMKELISGKASAEATVAEKEKQESKVVAVPVAPQVIVVQAAPVAAPAGSIPIGTVTGEKDTDMSIKAKELVIKTENVNVEKPKETK